MKFNHWPSIESFHRVVKDNKFALEETEYGVDRVVYRPKVKLHGSNAAITVESNGNVYAQSRSRIITPGPEDNCGFAAWVSEHKDVWAKNANQKVDLTIYGEWCGSGVQKGVAISNIDRKVFAIFAIQAGPSDDENSRVAVDPMEIEFALSHMAPDTHILPWYATDSFEVDFEKDLNAVVGVFNSHVDDVEQCDPWVKAIFDVEGLGEGLVYYPISFTDENGALPRGDMSRFMFKAKGEKHKVVKTKKAVEIDPVVAKSVDDFVTKVVTPGRLDQAVNEACKGEFDKKLIGPFIAWFNKDVKKDVDSGEVDLPEGCDWKLVNKPMTTKARTWYIEKAEEL